MKYCPTCQAQFEGDEIFCPHDGTRLLTKAAHQPGRLAGTSLAGKVNLEAFLYVDHLGERYRGRLLSDNSDVRVLVFHRRFDAQRIETVRQKFALLGSPLPHEILSLHSIDGEAEPIFLIEEQAQRDTLARLLKKKGRLDWKQALFLAIRIARILDWLADEGIPHRAVHPRSIFVDNPRSASIQIGELPVGLLAFPLPPLEDNTPADAIPVYPGFIAPEWCDPQADVDLHQAATFTAGAVLMASLGHPLFDDESLNETSIKAWLANPNRSNISLSLDDDAPSNLEVLANMMVAPDPKKRFQTPEAAIKALSNLLDMDPLEVAPALERAPAPAFAISSDRPSTQPVPFPDIDEDMGETEQIVVSASKTQIGLPAQVVSEPTTSSAGVVDDPVGDETETETETDDENDEATWGKTAPLESISLQTRKAEKKDDDVDPVDDETVSEEQDDDDTGEKKTLLMSAVSVDDIDKFQQDGNEDDEAEAEGSKPESRHEEEKVEKEKEEEEKVEVENDGDEEESEEDEKVENSSTLVSGESQSASAEKSDSSSAPAESGPSIIVDDEEVVTDSETAEIEREETSPPKEEESPSEKMEIGFVEAPKQSDGEEFADPWFGRSSEDAWEDTLTREAYERSRSTEKLVRIGIVAALFVLAIGVVVFTMTYEPEEEVVEEEETTGWATDEDPVDVDAIQSQFDEAMAASRLLQPRDSSALVALRELRRHATQDVYDTSRQQFVREADRLSRHYEEAGHLQMAHTLAGYASEYDEGNQELRERAEAMRDAYLTARDGTDAGESSDVDQQEGEEAEDAVQEAATTGAGGSQAGTQQSQARATNPAPRFDRSATLRQAKQAVDNDQLDRAKELYHQVLQHSPNDVEANAQLAQIHFDEAEHRQALQFQRRAVAGSPSNISYRLQLGMIYFRLTDYEEAIGAWEEVLDMEPGNAYAQRYIDLVERSRN